MKKSVTMWGARIPLFNWYYEEYMLGEVGDLYSDSTLLEFP